MVVIECVEQTTTTTSNSNNNSNSNNSSNSSKENEETRASAAAAPSENDEEEDEYHDSLDDHQLQQKTKEEANDAKVEGNKLFGEGMYEDALFNYNRALRLADGIPAASELRSVCHSNRATCFFKLGKYDDSIKECKKALDLNPSYMKALLRRAEAHEKLEHYDEAVVDMRKIFELDPSNDQASKSIVRLEPLAREKQEKMKEEMIGKLKEMGNSLLGKFGMSVDNFKAVQDPNTGSYSISFQR